MNLDKQVMVLGVKRMDFQNGNDTVKGTQVHIFGEAVNEQDVKGCIPSKAWLPYEAFDKFAGKEFPLQAIAKYEIDLAKSKLKIVDFDFIPVSTK